jgi:hypothetical protein
MEYARRLRFIKREDLVDLQAADGLLWFGIRCNCAGAEIHFP